MYFCAACGVKNCAKEFGSEGEYPKNCPTLSPVIEECQPMYDDPKYRKLAQVSTVCSTDHSEPRVKKTIRFMKEYGIHKVGIALCANLRDDAMKLEKLLREEGFQVESVICKVGHLDRVDVLDLPAAKKAMCNPLAQAEFLNQAGTEMNIILGLCVGHDTLFIMHSKAPVTVLAAKDHVYKNAPMEFFKNQG